MEVYIFLSEANFESLDQAVPKDSKSRGPLDRWTKLEERGFPMAVGNIALTCDEEESRDLLSHAQSHCKAAAESISLAMRAAGIRL